MNFRDIYRTTVSDRLWKLPFGKHRGLTIDELMDADPQYLQWCIDKDMFELDHILLDEFEERNPWMADDYVNKDSVPIGVEPNTGEVFY